MSNNKNHIRIFEHQTLKLNQVLDGICFDTPKLKALQNFYGEKGVPYYSLINNGIKFCQYVGVIQVGTLSIEVLPKVENKTEDKQKATWQKMLIDMLKAVGIFSVHAPSQASLNLKSNSLLDLYFELFIQEIEYLLHKGLIKKYRKTESNLYALKGNLQFNKHIQQNLVHQERFYVKHSSYDTENIWHKILYKALKLIKLINTNQQLQSRIGALLLHFPEMPDIKITEAVFEKLLFDRKTIPYQKAIEIAQLLLLKYHPDIQSGKNHVLALMFDMNLLWERFVFVSLKKHLKEAQITPQLPRHFWQSSQNLRSTIVKPDIYIKYNEVAYILDTKWKDISDYNPSAEDLRQMYVYHEFYNAEKVALVYPSSISENKQKGGFFYDTQKNKSKKECSIVLLKVEPSIKNWQETICKNIQEWIAGKK